MMASISVNCLFVFPAKPDLDQMELILISSRFLPEFQPIRAGLSFSNSFCGLGQSEGLLLAGTAILEADLNHFIFGL